MSYSSDLKPAKILNLPILEELANRIYLKKEDDYAYYSMKYQDSNAKRFVFSLATSSIGIEPTIRVVDVIKKNKKFTDYESFAIESGTNASGIAVILIKEDSPKNFFCNIRLLPFSKLSDIADKDTNSEVLTVDLSKAETLLKMDITISPSNTGEAMFSTHDIDPGTISSLITQEQLLRLKKDLEFHGAKIAAHFCQEILNIVLSEKANDESDRSLSDDYILNLPSQQLKDLLLAMSINGNVCIEIVGVDAVKDLNKDWMKASNFIGYIL